MMTPEQEQRWSEAIERLFQRTEPFILSVDSPFALWCLLSAVQLACRHPEFEGPTRETAEKLARDIGGQLIGEDRDLERLFEAGWNPEYDQPK